MDLDLRKAVCKYGLMSDDEIQKYEPAPESVPLTPDQQRIQDILDSVRKTPGPKKTILDEGLIERLASIMCTVDEIASVLETTPDIVAHNYSHIVNAGRNKGKTSLRRHQWHVAEKGNPSMLIWLGKQYLNQTDKIVTAEDPNIRNIPDISRLTINERKEILMRVKNSDIGEKQVENAKDKEATRPSKSTVQPGLSPALRKDG